MDLPVPGPLHISFFAYYNPPIIPDEVIEDCRRNDLVVALGGCDLDLLAESLPKETPALAVLGPKDKREVPAPFKPLHANGFTFRDWRIAGFSTAPQLRKATPGNYTSEEEADQLLASLAPCDILLTHAPPATRLKESNVRTELGFRALDIYLQEKVPIYHFYAHPEETIAEDIGDTLVVGVCGYFNSPEIVFV
jgi:Icc-related predicted phosphoesterase